MLLTSVYRIDTAVVATSSGCRREVVVVTWPANWRCRLLDRRRFLGSAVGLAGAFSLTDSLLAQVTSVPSDVPDPSLYDRNEEAYWNELRKLFLRSEEH